MKNCKKLFQGLRKNSNGLWDYQTKITQPKMPMSYIITKDKTKSDLARYYLEQ